MKKEAKFIRKGHIIRDAATGNTFFEGVDNTTGFSSINAAKRKSRELQPQLGDGTLRVAG